MTSVSPVRVVRSPVPVELSYDQILPDKKGVYWDSNLNGLRFWAGRVGITSLRLQTPDPGIIQLQKCSVRLSLSCLFLFQGYFWWRNGIISGDIIHTDSLLTQGWRKYDIFLTWGIFYPVDSRHSAFARCHLLSPGDASPLIVRNTLPSTSRLNI